jgi:mannose-6-phosphate isomerase-like protein (cupin superfamily)
MVDPIPSQTHVKKKLAQTTPGEWEGIDTLVYKPEGTDFKDIVRRTLVKDVEGINFELRYFEVASEGYSSLEKHEHTHTVIIARGRGRAIVGDEMFPARQGDVFVVPAMHPHQFIQEGEEPFGFYCMVSESRDRPCLLEADEKEQLRKKVNFLD